MPFLFRFDFYKIFDVNTDNRTSNSDEYVYKALKVWVSLGEEKVFLRVCIPGFQRFIRLRIEITEKENSLQVIVRDPDYGIKLQYYDEASRQ
jgi:hypothetical protein